MGKEKYTSQKLSEELKAAGAKQNSTQCWYLPLDADPVLAPSNGPYREITEDNTLYSAFDCFELFERLPTVAKDARDYHLTIRKDGSPKETVYSACFQTTSAEYLPSGFESIGPSQVEVLGELYLWCLAQGYCEEQKTLNK